MMLIYYKNVEFWKEFTNRSRLKFRNILLEQNEEDFDHFRNVEKVSIEEISKK